MKTIETGRITILIDSKQFESLNTTIKEQEMKKARMSLIENVEILSNVSQKTLGYTIAFRGKQHIITPKELEELASSSFIKRVLGDFCPIRGAVILTNSYGLPGLTIQSAPAVSFTAPMPCLSFWRDHPTKDDLIQWVESFNKFLDAIDALNIENVEIPTFKNIVLV